MLTMPAPTKVTAEDIAHVRRWAAEVDELASDRYTGQRVAATYAALDWVEGLTVVAPVTGEPMVATPANVHMESVRAADRENAHQRASEFDAMAWPGAVFAALEWVLGRGRSPF